MRLSDSARSLLELDKILDLFASRCRSDLGLLALLRLEPASEGSRLRARHELFRDYLRFRDRFGELPWSDDLRTVTELLVEAKTSSHLTGEELLRIRTLLSVASRIRLRLSEEKEDFPFLWRFSRKIREFDEELKALSVIADDGKLYDSASPKLSKIRKSLEQVRNRLRRDGQKLLNDPSIQSMLQDRLLSLRNGRFVVLVKQEHVGVFPGIVVDRSVSGNTLYMEPNGLVPLNNSLALLLQEEREEEHRLFREITEAMLRREGALADAEAALAWCDLAYGAGEMMDRRRWTLPEVTDKALFDLRKVVHPLLGEKAVAIDIQCGRRFRQLVVTGPNTGGKTVALKTVGVALSLAWYGLPVPAAEGTVVGEIGAILIDIGDEQSIEQNLSTFSAHMRNIISILGEAEETSLVLLDELGAGTDPQEGAALGISILEELLERRSLVLATTHHNPIKRFALTAGGVETASVEFDPFTLSPTYRLLMGIPGRSNALLIASRLGLPPGVVERAKAALSEEGSAMDELIGRLQAKQSYLDRLEAEMTREKEATDRLGKTLEEELACLEQRREGLIEEADRKAASILDDAERTARSLLKELQGAAASAAHRQMTSHKRGVDGLRDEAERRSLLRKKRLAGPPGERPLAVGDEVAVAGSAIKGAVAEIRGKKAVVQAGSLRVDVPLEQLRLTARKEAAPVETVKINVSRPQGVPSSVMVRGMTVDEALPILERYLDQAYRAGYSEVTLIHGRGTGVLRQVVQDLCKETPYVEEYRLGGPGEGGYGVTVVRFRRK
ncbi:endonuclease MutS2 [Aminithiophilus ramosus]|uniref:Endonuclease MutS2 n=2 Tax=Synergistales TaxID=649776 RepID=A0A9Q7A4T4_9BACT|nr:endonuclease MutS2 [Aminithiophilus ramosus]QTX31335.1 endonuclease MutS2 [Aminithiophilus ramosus]QVL35134.1 endonuclease MutS2 [Synergistota bacterium]